MSNVVFNARFTPTAASSLGPDTYQVTADIFDGTGTYSGLDVTLDDIIFLDSFNSITAPNSVSRYTVDSIIDLDISSVTLVLKYADTGDPVDPSEILGNPGFIARASAQNSLVYHAAPTIHSFPDYVTQYARDYDNFIRLDELLGSAGSSSVSRSYSNQSGDSIDEFTPVRQNNSGNIAKIDPSVEAEVVSIIGILLETTANNSTGLVALSGLVENVTTSFSVNDTLYLSKTGGLTATPPDIGVESFVAGDFVVKVGKVLKNTTNPANKDFKLEVELKGQL